MSSKVDYSTSVYAFVLSIHVVRFGFMCHFTDSVVPKDIIQDKYICQK